MIKILKILMLSRYHSLRVGVPLLGHVLKHVPRHALRHVPVRHALEHVPGHMLEHMPRHVHDRHVLDRHIPEQVLGFNFCFREKKLARILF